MTIFLSQKEEEKGRPKRALQLTGDSVSLPCLMPAARQPALAAGAGHSSVSAQSFEAGSAVLAQSDDAVRQEAHGEQRRKANERHGAGDVGGKERRGDHV